VEKQTTLILYQNLPVPTIRLNNWSVPQMPSLWSGDLSATSLYDSVNTKYYCLVTVATTCSNYGQGGAKTYRWISQNRDNTMKLNVPSDRPFRISVEYYEKCGPFWTGGATYGRGKWYTELSVGYSPQIAITNWAWLIKENC